METPAHSRAFGTASAGAIGKSIGSVAASAKPRTRASGVQPSAAAFSALIKIIAQAPSFNVDALPAVTVPSFLKTARRLPNLDSLKRVYSSSLVTTVSGYNRNVIGGQRGGKFLTLPRFPLIVTGVTSASKTPLSQAAADFLYEPIA